MPRVNKKEIQKYLKQIKLYSNEELLRNVIYDAWGDHLDGGFTFMGEVKFDELKKELAARLKRYKFIERGFKWKKGFKW